MVFKITFEAKHKYQWVMIATTKKDLETELKIYYFPLLCIESHFPGCWDGKESAYIVGDLGSIPGLGRSPGDGNGNPLQYSCLENPMDGEA